MSALANHAFAKMNGIGNEIVVVDLRDAPAAVTPEDARAVASPAGVHYDQLMVLQPPRLAGTEAFIRIYNNDGSESGACGVGPGERAQGACRSAPPGGDRRGLGGSVRPADPSQHARLGALPRRGLRER